MKLTKKQKETVEKMKIGIEYSAYELQCPISTLDGLSQKGIVKCINSGCLGSGAMPRVALKWGLINTGCTF